MPPTQVLGIIPARGGSRGIRHKNMAPLNGRPLIGYTLDAACASQTLTHVIVSTDDPAIADYAQRHSVEAPFRRPPHLARDDTPMLPVLQHAIQQFESSGQHRPQAVVLLQPTSPLRTAQHIDDAVGLLLTSGCDSVVSVVRVPHAFNPTSVMRLEQGRLVPFLPGEGATRQRRQDKPVCYARNGPAVLACQRNVLIDGDRLYGQDCRPYEMPANASIDIDTPQDLALAGCLLLRQGASPATDPSG